MFRHWRRWRVERRRTANVQRLSARPPDVYPAFPARGGVGGAEWRAQLLLARTYGAEPLGPSDDDMSLLMGYGRMVRQPACMGPLLVHLDGAWECHGANCPGVEKIFHPQSTVTSCTDARAPTRHACPRCVRPAGLS